jgi:hypothetical protein
MGISSSVMSFDIMEPKDQSDSRELPFSLLLLIAHPHRAGHKQTLNHVGAVLMPDI